MVKNYKNIFDVLDAALTGTADGSKPSGNLFDSAKDTVLSIVKTVLKTNDKDKKSGLCLF